MSRSSDRAGITFEGPTSPLTLFVLTSFVLTVFGIVMVYSASSIVCLESDAMGNNPAYYAIRQGGYALVGVVGAVVLAKLDYHKLTGVQAVRIGIFVAIVALLLMTFAFSATYGATRWIRLPGGIGIQPSEFAKIAVILLSASIFQEYFEDRTIGLNELVIELTVALLPIIVLVFKQPDKGTTLIMLLTVAVMLFVAGLRPIIAASVAGGSLGVVLLYAYTDAYSRARMEIMHNPWLDEYGDGYQLVQGLYAFACGGLKGVGLGMSRQKYSYLPMAHNDFIFAIVGEELGFVGTVSVLAAFLLLMFLGFMIARNAPDLTGRLIASGCVSLMIIQLAINVSGILGIIPLSGKPIPFLSYGGSSIMATLMMVGLVCSVAIHSDAPQGAYEGRRSSLSVYEGRSQSGFRVLSGGVTTTPERLRESRDFASAHADGRITTNANGSRRIDLGPSPSDRLRGRGSSRGGRE